jgi:hypothetical protein
MAAAAMDAASAGAEQLSWQPDSVLRKVNKTKQHESLRHLQN